MCVTHVCEPLPVRIRNYDIIRSRDIGLTEAFLLLHDLVS